jgi:hypothetical protein
MRESSSQSDIMAGQSKSKLGDDLITNDVYQIDQNKIQTFINGDGDQEDNKNYNSGRVKLKCIINRYCPVLKGQHANYGLVFNSNTTVSISEDVAKNFAFVPGLDGMFLKPRFNWRSTFLAFPVRSKDVIDVSESLVQDGGELDVDVIWNAFNNPFQSTVDTIGKTERLEQYMDSLFAKQTPPTYVGHQTWVAVPSPVDNKNVPNEHNYLCDGPCPSDQSAARWKYVLLPRPTENDGVVTKNSTQPTAGSATVAGRATEEQTTGPFASSQESEDSYVLFPAQMAAAPVDYVIPRDPTETIFADDPTTKKEGIHWRVKKQTPLFKGEDFFMEIRNIAIERDPQNIESKPFKDSNFDFLDVHTEGEYSGAVINGRYTGKLPTNWAVVNYKSGVKKTEEESTATTDDNGASVDYGGELEDEVSNETPEDETPETITTVVKHFEKVEDSVKFFDLHKQPYLILEMKGTNAHYFFVFAEKTQPICFKVIDIPDDAADVAGEGSKYKISVVLSEYNAISCKSLFEETGFAMSVRNHLGKIVVTFLGAEDKPWIIENPVINSSSTEDPIFRVPDQCELYLWGGNYAAAFSFSPLQYNHSADIDLPPRTGSEDNSEVNSSVFTVSDFGIGSHHLVLSSSDIVPEKYRTSAEYKKVIYSVTGTSDKPGTDLYVGSRTPFYTCDAHWVTEIGFKRGNDTPISYDRGYDKDVHCTFTNTGDYIKDSNDGLFGGKISSAGHLEDPSSITIEAKVLKGVSQKITSQGLGPAAQDMIQNDLNSKHFAIAATLDSGSYTFSESGGYPEWTLNDCITPIISNLRFVSNPLEESAWDPVDEGIDVSAHVTKFSDSWTSSDFYTAEHSGSVSFIISEEGGNETLSHSTELEEMKDKAFYIEVWAGYDNCSYTFGPVEGDGGGLFYKLFTGICFGGTITQEPIIRRMECKIEDYSKILKDTLFFNSPFFDGMRDVNAVYEILKIASFKDRDKGTGSNDGIYGASDPASEVSLSCDGTVSPYESTTADGRKYTCSGYILPFSYDRIQNPFFRFKDGSNTYEAISGFAKRASKMMFFDAFGVFHYQDSMGIKMSTLTNSELDEFVLWKFRTGEMQEFDDTGYQLIFNTMTKQGTVEDVYNVIHMRTSTPKFELIVGNRTNWASITDPSIKGFLGYKRTMVQIESTFGNVETLKNVMDLYKSVWVPPLAYNFETYGQPLRIFDIISVDDNNMLVVGVSSDIDPQANKWNQTIEGEWFGVYAPSQTQGDSGVDTGGGIQKNIGIGGVTNTGTGSVTVGGQVFQSSGITQYDPGSGSVTVRGQTHVHSNGTTLPQM